MYDAINFLFSYGFQRYFSVPTNGKNVGRVGATLSIANPKKENRYLKETYAEEHLKAEIIAGAMAKKMVAPSQRLEMAQRTRQDKGINVRLACETFDISHTYYYYQPELLRRTVRSQIG